MDKDEQFGQPVLDAVILAILDQPRRAARQGRGSLVKDTRPYARTTARVRTHAMLCLKQGATANDHDKQRHSRNNRSS
jgi:hypothetical protein